jgi:hypothetical protein
VPLPPHALLVLIVVRVLPLSVRFTNALLSLSLLGVNSPPVVVAGDTSGECRFAYGDTQPATTIEGSVAYNQDSINALLSLSLLGVNSPPVVVAGDTVVSIMSSGLFSKSI